MYPKWCYSECILYFANNIYNATITPAFKYIIMLHIKIKPVALISLFSSTAIAQSKPNVIVILVDDMGFSDISCYGGEIPTPNIDKLANNGLRFRNFYNTARSCPSRASLLTGLYSHQTGIGLMASGSGYDFDFKVDGYRGYLNKNCITIAEVLKENGYNTFMTGKWHVGSNDTSLLPLARGFDKFYGSYEGALNYFEPKGMRCLIDNKDTISAPKGFYSTDAFTDKSIEYIKGITNEKPFFLYLAYNAPHWPLQAKQSDVEMYKGKYMRGWDKLREERFQRQIKLGIVGKNVVLSPRDARVRAWDDVSQAQKIESDYRMAVYAAQIHSIDINVGKLIDYLKNNQLLENTLILFLSDNGACAEPYAEFGGGKFEDVNNPKKEGLISYGICWANLSNTPFHSFKSNSMEGGICTPLIAHWPKVIKSQRSKITNTQGHVMNIMPTILDVIGASYPKTYKGKDVYPIESSSLLQTFKHGKQANPEYMFWEHSNICAVRKGKWKAVSEVGSGKWKLFNLETDRTELIDISKKYPDILIDLASRWQSWANDKKVLPKGTPTKNSFK